MNGILPPEPVVGPPPGPYCPPPTPLSSPGPYPSPLPGPVPFPWPGPRDGGASGGLSSIPICPFMIGNDFGSTLTVGLMVSAEYSITGGSGMEGGGGTPLLVRLRSLAPPPPCGRCGWDRLPPSDPVPDFAWFFSVFMRMVGSRMLTSFKG